MFLYFENLVKYDTLKKLRFASFSMCVLVCSLAISTIHAQCFENNFCNDPSGKSSAKELPTPVSQNLGICEPHGEPVFVCIDGCNASADPEPDLTSCTGPLDPVVWYKFTTDATASALNISVTSDEILMPSIQLFLSQNGTCTPLINAGLTPDYFGCMVGSNGRVIANSTPVGPSTTYYLAIGGVNSPGGDFTLCITTLESSARCVTDASVDIVSRSYSGSLQGPFFPGETVGICMRVNEFTVSTGAQNCQWFQGIVPVFGNGWAPGSFDALGQPKNATLNGRPFPAVNVHNGGQFDWWPHVMYHHPHCFYNVGDFDGNGTLDICNGLFDVDCTGPGLPGGGVDCFGPCWNSSGPDDPGCGSLLPPGWFTSGVDGSCAGLAGWPAVDWGDGNTCDGPTGPWHFCFDLVIRSHTSCIDEDPTTRDLTLGFVAFADGQTGSWTGGPSVCGEDEPVFRLLHACCADWTSMYATHDPICSKGMFSWTLDDPDVIHWKWNVQAPSAISGARNGEGFAGTVVSQNLTNTGNTTHQVIYTFLGFGEGPCPVFIKEVSVDVFAPIQVSLGHARICVHSEDPYLLTPIVHGGDQSYTYLWQDGSTESSLSIPFSGAGQTYSVTVTDATGCAGSASVVPEIYEVFQVDIDAPVTEQCITHDPILLKAGIPAFIEDYTMRWTNEIGDTIYAPEVSATTSGQWLVVVEDSYGCSGRDSVFIALYEPPDWFWGERDSVAFCDENVDILSVNFAVGGYPPYVYTIEVVPVPHVGAQITISVVDHVGCEAITSFFGYQYDKPTIEVDTTGPFCKHEFAEGILIGVEFSPDVESYFLSQGWSDPEFTVFTPGSYHVTATNGHCDTTRFVLIQQIETIAGFQVLIDDNNVSFINTSANAESFHWDFGDGSTSDEEHPEHHYAETGLYNVTLIVNGPCGSDTISSEVHITTSSIRLIRFVEFVIVPNPGTGRFSILPDQVELAGWKIVDVLGRDVRFEVVGRNTFEIINPVPGIYFLVIQRRVMGVPLTYMGRIVVH